MPLVAYIGVQVMNNNYYQYFIYKKKKAWDLFCEYLCFGLFCLYFFGKNASLIKFFFNFESTAVIYYAGGNK